jgi:hypothetical protein
MIGNRPSNSLFKLSAAALVFLAPFFTHRISIGDGASPKHESNKGVDHAVVKPVMRPDRRVPKASMLGTYGSLPLTFEPNEGQLEASVRYVAHGAGYTLFLSGSEAVLSLPGPDEGDRILEKMDARTRKRFEARRFYQVSPRFHRHPKLQTISVAVEGANPSPNILSLDQLPGKANYFIGRDPQQWRADIPMFARVQYSAIYPGIDLIYYGKRGRLEFDFVVSPGADPNAIRLRFQGSQRTSITKDGKLHVLTPQGSFDLLCPEIYQVRNGKRIPVRGRFAVRRDHRTVGIQVAKYDTRAQLVIDPVLSYSTYVGGNGSDYDSGVAVDAQGNAYIAGMTNSTNFPTFNGYASSGSSNGVAFITKLNPEGTAVLYSTYLGGTGGDWAAGMALDPSGRVYVTGSTLSVDFPIVNGFQTSLGSPNGNAFAAVIDATQTGTASLVYSTYLGGGGNGSNSLGDVGLAIAADASGYAYVTGQTASDSSTAGFPITSTALQSSLASTNGNAFLAILDTANGVGPSSLMYSTYLGGASGGFGDYGLGITADNSGNVYLTGQTTSGGSTPFPTTAGAFQTTLNSQYGNVFVTELANGQGGVRSLAYSTYLGGSSAIIVGDVGSGVGLDSTGKVYVGGDTTSADFPVTSGAFQTTNSPAGKAFVAAFDPTQSGVQSLVYSTLLGGTNGSEGEVANALTVDSNGHAFVVGSTSSSDFPTTSDAFQSSIRNSSWDAFLAEVDPTGASLLYSTYFGGTCADGDLGNGVAIDLAGNSYLAGATCSSDFPITSGAYQSTLAGTRNAYVAEIPLPTSAVGIQINPQNPTLANGATQQFSAIATLNNGNTLDLTTSANWASSNASVLLVTTLPQTQGFGVGLSSGTATLTVTVGTLTASTSVTVVPAPPTPAITSVSPTSGSAGTQVTVSGSGFGTAQGGGYLWLGSTLGTISSWSDTQIIATVAAISTSGTVQVTQGGLQSNSVNFSVANPTITSISPTTGVAGTQVAISGSGFGGTQGNGQVWLGSSNGTVSSWSDTQVVATVASGSVSGNAQILQGGVWSSSVAFTVLMPIINSVTPTSGGAGTSVTIAGSGFGASQGSSAVWLGGAYAGVTSWSDTQVIAVVGSSAVTGVAKIQENGSWSNAVLFAVPPTQGSGSSIALFPNIIGMPVGETRSIQALNSNNQTVSGLAWTSSDTTILTLSTDDPPLLTAVAPGNATIFAGGASADVTLYPGPTLPVGTLEWSNPGDPSDVDQVIPAVPSTSGTDLFALEQDESIVQAVYRDGTVAWTNSVNGFDNSFLADFQGGLVVFGSGVSNNRDTSIYKLDGVTGQPYPAYMTTTNEGISNGLEYPAIHTDGTIFTVDYACDTSCPNNPDSTDGAWVVGINPSTGVPKLKVPLANSVVEATATDSWCYGTPGTTTTYVHSWPSSLMIAGDGYLYTTYTTEDSTGTERKSPAQRFPMPAYQNWNQLLQDTGNSNFSAALADVGGLGNLIDTSGIIAALNQGDRTGAILAEDYQAPLFVHLCDSSATTVTKLHILRVGTDGSSSDMVLNQWTYGQSTVHSASPNGNNGSNLITTTQTQSGPPVGFNGPSMITNSGTGAVFSWQLDKDGYCALSVDSANPLLGLPPQCMATVYGGKENHLATTSGTSVASDVIWTPPLPSFYPEVNPALQLQDGSFVGIAGFAMLNFTASGSVRWSIPYDSPAIATVDGGLIGTSDVTYDQNGNATGQVVVLPTFGNVFGQSSGLPTYSWTGKAYEVAFGSVDEVFSLPFNPAAPLFWSFSGANPSENGTSPLCRDDRDQLTKEYSTYSSGFIPFCSSFTPSTNAQPSSHFSFSELNAADINHGDFPDWAILRSYFLNGLENTRTNYQNQSITLSRAYSSPYVQQQINPGEAHSRHIHGDAADMATGSVQTIWNALHNAALTAGACVEPENRSGVNHVHADWRRSDGVACAATWLQ